MANAKDTPILMPFPPPMPQVPTVIQEWLQEMATAIGSDCPHEWMMRLPARNRMPARTADIQWYMIMPLRLTCRHCAAWLRLEERPDGQVRVVGERMGAEQ